MIRIPYSDNNQFTLEGFDTLLTVHANRKKLKKGKKVNLTMKNIRFLFPYSLFMFFSAVVIYLLSDKPLQGMDLVIVPFCVVFGVLCLAANIAYPKWLGKWFSESRENGVKADFVFDEEGVHVWESEEKGFDKKWDEFTDCFISSEYIFVFFDEMDYTLVMTNEDETEPYVLDALKLGNRSDIILRFVTENGKVRGLPDSSTN